MATAAASSDLLPAASAHGKAKVVTVTLGLRPSQGSGTGKCPPRSTHAWDSLRSTYRYIHDNEKVMKNGLKNDRSSTLGGSGLTEALQSIRI